MSTPGGAESGSLLLSPIPGHSDLPQEGSEVGLCRNPAQLFVFPRFFLQLLLLTVFLAQRCAQGLAEALASFLM